MFWRLGLLLGLLWFLPGLLEPGPLGLMMLGVLGRPLFWFC